MMNIRSSADLRNQYKEISELARVSENLFILQSMAQETACL